MCFSPFASFTATAGLSLLSLISFRISQTREQKLLATVPLVFAIQQAIEGMIWLNAGQQHIITSMPLVYAFLFFAFLWWPTFIPLATMWSEKMSVAPSREAHAVQLVQLLCSISGVITALFLAHGLFSKTTQAVIENHHIVYNTPWMPTWAYATYILATIIPLLISRMRYVWMLGLAAAASLAYSNHLYTNYTVSVWCFFAAVLSGIIIIIIYLQNKKENPYSR